MQFRARLLATLGQMYAQRPADLRIKSRRPQHPYRCMSRERYASGSQQLIAGVPQPGTVQRKGRMGDLNPGRAQCGPGMQSPARGEKDL